MRRMLYTTLFVFSLLNTSVWATQATVSNSDLSVMVDDATCKLQVTVADGGRVWTQPTVTGSCSGASSGGSTLTWTYSNGANWPSSTVTLVLSGKSFEVTISGSGSVASEFSTQYPQRFLTGSGDKLILPYSEGMIVPNTDTTAIPADTFARFYTGYYVSLPLFGVWNNSTNAGYMAIVETAYDASFYVRQDGSYLSPVVNWESQKGQTGYDRKVLYYFYGSGFSHVTMASLFRTWADGQGFIRTLTQKTADNANVSKLIGAGEYYVIGSADETIYASLANSAGLAKAMIAVGDYSWVSAGDKTTFNASYANYLLAAYDIYNDAWGSTSSCHHKGLYDPGTSTISGYGVVKSSAYVGPSTEADTSAWVKSGYTTTSCGAVPGAGEAWYISRRFMWEALSSDTNNDLVQRRVPTIAALNRLHAIMLDTEGATRLIEDYDPNHLQTRSTDVDYRRLILGFHNTNGFITGTEMCQWWHMDKTAFCDGVWTLTATPGFATNPSSSTNSSTYQTAVTYRIPLFSLIYSDVAMRYNRWDDRFEQFAGTSTTEMVKKKLWFALYGMMPLTRDRNSIDTPDINYGTVVFPAADDVEDTIALVAGQRMTNHEFLTADWTQQRTTWANGVTITVNFTTQTVTVGTTSNNVRLGIGNFKSFRVY
jgi:hypothetical protein